MPATRRRTKQSRKSKPELPPPQAAAPPQATAPPQPGLLYTDREVATFLRLRNYRTLAQWRIRGRHPELQPVKDLVGSQKAVLYRGSDIIAFLSGESSKRNRRAR
jgi:hypothetical protein